MHWREDEYQCNNTINTPNDRHPRLPELLLASPAIGGSIGAGAHSYAVDLPAQKHVAAHKSRKFRDPLRDV